MSKAVLFQTIQFSASTVSMSKTVLFQTIQFHVSTKFKYQNRSISSKSVYHKYSVKFYLTHRYDDIRCYHSGASVDLKAMAMKGYSVFSKGPALLEPRYQIVYCHIQDTRWDLFYSIQPIGQNKFGLSLERLVWVRWQFCWAFWERRSSLNRAVIYVAKLQ